MKKLFYCATVLFFLATASFSHGAIVSTNVEVVTGKITSITFHKDRYIVKINSKDGKEMAFKHGYQTLYVLQNNKLLLKQINDCKDGKHTIATIAYQAKDGKIIRVACYGPKKRK